MSRSNGDKDIMGLKITKRDYSKDREGVLLIYKQSNGGGRNGYSGNETESKVEGRKIKKEQGRVRW